MTNASTLGQGRVASILVSVSAVVMASLGYLLLSSGGRSYGILCAIPCFVISLIILIVSRERAGSFRSIIFILAFCVVVVLHLFAFGPMVALLVSPVN